MLQGLWSHYLKYLQLPKKSEMGLCCMVIFQLVWTHIPLMVICVLKFYMICVYIIQHFFYFIITFFVVDNKERWFKICIACSFFKIYGNLFLCISTVKIYFFFLWLIVRLISGLVYNSITHFITFYDLLTFIL